MIKKVKRMRLFGGRIFNIGGRIRKDNVKLGRK